MSSAVYQSTDTTTQGGWHGVYSPGDLYQIRDLAPTLPAGITWSELSNVSEYTWNGSVADNRALYKFTEPNRIASVYYTTSNASPAVFEVNLNDGATRDMSLYFLDWDSGARRQSVSILDYATSSALDTRNLNYDLKATPTWITWRVTGHVKVSLQCTGGDVGVVSAFLFSDPVAASGPTAQQLTGMFPNLF